MGGCKTANGMRELRETSLYMVWGGSIVLSTPLGSRAWSLAKGVWLLGGGQGTSWEETCPGVSSRVLWGEGNLLFVFPTQQRSGIREIGE